MGNVGLLCYTKQKLIYFATDCILYNFTLQFHYSVKKMYVLSSFLQTVRRQALIADSPLILMVFLVFICTTILSQVLTEQGLADVHNL